MLPTFAADTAVDVRGIGAVLKIITTGCRQGCIQLLRPFLVGLGEPPYLIGRQAQVTDRRPERLAGVDRIQKLLAHLGR